MVFILPRAVVPSNYQTSLTFFIYAILLLGGAATVFGPIIGSVIFWVLLSFFSGFIARAVEVGWLPFLSSVQAGQLRFILVGVAIMLMTGADERGVQAIEKLTKQKFTQDTVEVERSAREPRRERSGDSGGQRAERSERGGRTRDERGGREGRSSDGRSEGRSYAPPAKPVDEFFLKPYESSPQRETAVTAAGGTPAVQPSAPRGGKVAALLGGGKR
jgi:hypothetical protein